MRKSYNLLRLLPVIWGLLFLATACDPGKNGKLTIAVSANMQYAMEELVEAFQHSTGTPCEMIVGSSGKLTAQIMEGAPFDLFLSADMKYPKEIYSRDLAYGEPQVYALGYLVLWSLDEDTDLTSEGLLSENVRHVALANPETAPYGVAAVDLLRGMGILDEIRRKLVYGESIAQTNQFILSGSAQVGITARSVVSAPAARDKGHWAEADPGLYRPIQQGIVVMKGEGSRLESALAFAEFLRSPSAREILIRFGYGVENIE
jgi:molybdate transport system substrate-binding protein